jgi:hypothetical protein
MKISTHRIITPSNFPTGTRGFCVDGKHYLCFYVCSDCLNATNLQKDERYELTKVGCFCEMPGCGVEEEFYD